MNPCNAAHNAAAARSWKVLDASLRDSALLEADITGERISVEALQAIRPSRGSAFQMQAINFPAVSGFDFQTQSPTAPSSSQPSPQASDTLSVLSQHENRDTIGFLAHPITSGVPKETQPQVRALLHDAEAMSHQSCSLLTVVHKMHVVVFVVVFLLSFSCHTDLRQQQVC